MLGFFCSVPSARIANDAEVFGSLSRRATRARSVKYSAGNKRAHWMPRMIPRIANARRHAIDDLVRTGGLLGRENPGLASKPKTNASRSALAGMCKLKSSAE